MPGKKITKNSRNEIERIVHALAKKYSHSVYHYEFEDLCQTIWYLILVAKKKYDPKRGSFERFAFYFADLKLKDHFWRGANFPEVKGEFSLLHIRARFIGEAESFPDKGNRTTEELPDIARLRIEGYTFTEISQKLKIPYGTLKRKWKTYTKSLGA